MTLGDIKKMQIGQVVDFVIAYNERMEEAERAQKYAEKHGRKRRASQSDIDAFFG